MIQTNLLGRSCTLDDTGKAVYTIVAVCLDIDKEPTVALEDVFGAVYVLPLVDITLSTQGL